MLTIPSSKTPRRQEPRWIASVYSRRVDVRNLRRWRIIGSNSRCRRGGLPESLLRAVRSLRRLG